MAHPAVLKDLVEQYETLCTLHAENGGATAGRRMDDVAYTLCGSTGTRTVEDALDAARRLHGTRAQGDAVLTGG